MMATFWVEMVASFSVKIWISKFKMRLPAIGLLLLTISFWSVYDRYEPVGPEMLGSLSLSEAHRVYGDIAEADAGRFVATVPEGGQRAGAFFRFSNATNHLILRARATVTFDDVEVGKYPWSCTRVCLFQRDAKKKGISTDHVLMGGWGSSRRIHYEDEFEIQSNTAFADFCLQQHATAGSAVFENLSLQPVQIRASFSGWRILFAGIWLAMGFYYFPVCRLRKRRLKGLILLNAIAILVGALMPGDWISDTAEKVELSWIEYRKEAVSTPVPVVTPGDIDMKKGAPQKVEASVDDESDLMLSDSVHGIGHFILFASLCFLVYLSAALERQHSSYFTKVGFDILVFAAITESLQFLTIDRTPNWGGLFFDLGGMMLAFVLFLCVLPFVQKRISAGLVITGE